MTLKETLFNKEKVNILGNQIKSVYPQFEIENFVNNSVSLFPNLELKERMSCVTKQLEKYLPSDFLQSLEILTESLKLRKEAMFIYGSVLEYVEKNGCNDEHVDISLKKLGEFTSALSSEFAIRPFLSKYPEKSLSKVLEWSRSDDVHVRRLASEGTRPSLPWAMKITVPYKEAAYVLNYLYYDPSRYVTRSVANHLNDISKIDPSFVLNTLKRWEKENKQSNEEMKYIIKHSLRTLIKKGHPETLDFLGYKMNPLLDIGNLELSATNLKTGEKLGFTFSFKALEDCKLIIDYIVYYPSKTKRRSSKTYKLTEIKTKKNKIYDVKGKRPLENMSTRKMKPGLHEIQIQINGNIVLKKEFNLD